MKNKILLSFILVLSYLPLSAQTPPPPQTISLYESSTQFGFCSGANYTFCTMDLTNLANRVALNNGINDCSLRGGQAAPNGNCNSQCFPFFLPYNAPYQSVNCNSQCYLDCHIP